MGLESQPEPVPQPHLCINHRRFLSQTACSNECPTSRALAPRAEGAMLGASIPRGPRPLLPGPRQLWIHITPIQLQHWLLTVRLHKVLRLQRSWEWGWSTVGSTQGSNGIVTENILKPHHVVKNAQSPPSSFQHQNNSHHMNLW